MCVLIIYEEAAKLTCKLKTKHNGVQQKLITIMLFTLDKMVSIWLGSSEDYTWTGTLCSMLCLFLSEGCVWFKVSRKILEKVNMGMWYFYVWCKFWKRIPKNTSYSYLSCFLFPWRKVDILYSHGKIEVIF